MKIVRSEKSVIYIMTLSVFCACTMNMNSRIRDWIPQEPSRDTVRLDTIDTYMISMNVEAPNGIEKDTIAEWTKL